MGKWDLAIGYYHSYEAGFLIKDVILTKINVCLMAVMKGNPYSEGGHHVRKIF